ncbi:hypothetical protein J4Q44_G00344180 [Coregonus suidteri]|uniref:Protein unc-93 homolog A n=1 Tax=Coregonus suidteri TaxID=861788 RepID=A0AAN8QML9_9TELE
MGVTSLSVIYASIILSSMFLTPILIKNLGCKWTIVAGMGCYVTYSIGNLFPGWYTLIPTSVILGMGGSPLWSAKCTLLTISGNLQAPKENKAAAHVINKYFGIFFLIFQSSSVLGNLMSSLIFGSDTDIRVGMLAMNIVAVFLDNIDRDQAQEFRGNREPFWSTFLATFTLLKDKRLVILIPLSMYSGFEQSFLSGEYTKNYVTSAVINFACILALLFWRPHPDQLPVFFVFPALWGMADAVWQAQTNSLYGVLFPREKEAAFANCCMWESLGFMIAFAYSTFICLDTKIYILLGVLILSMVTCLWAEYQEHKNPTLPVEEGVYDIDYKKDTDQYTDYSKNINCIIAQTSL